MYSKALRYTASSCTVLEAFLNRVQRNLRCTNLCSENLKQHGFLIILPFTLLSNKSCTNLSCTSFFIPQKMCISRPYCRRKLVNESKIQKVQIKRTYVSPLRFQSELSCKFQMASSVKVWVNRIGDIFYLFLFFSTFQTSFQANHFSW